MGDPTPGPALTRVETWEYQPLPDEGGAYVPRLEEADVATRDTESPGVFHGFLGRKALIPRARQTAEDVCSALRVAFEV
jgi:acetyl esterase/lipase